MPRVAAYGDLLLDVIMYFDEELSLSDLSFVARGAVVGPGGGAGNFSVAIARLGHEATLISAVGRDPLGSYLVDDLEASSVGVDRVLRLQGPTGVMAVVVGRDGRRTIFGFRGASALRRISPEEAHEISSESDAIYVSGFAVLNEDGPSSILNLFGASRGRVALTMLDLSGFGPQHVDVIKGLRGLLDVVASNLDEAKALVGSADPEAAVRAIYGLARPRVGAVLKMGAAGSIFFDGNSAVRVPALKVRAVDTTGAGDAFNAGLMAGLLEGEGPREACRLASALAAYKVTGEGARHLPRGRQELERFVEEVGGGWPGG
ncbi:MAG: sugar kinase [Desulfurococcaceae archaeon]